MSLKMWPIRFPILPAIYFRTIPGTQRDTAIGCRRDETQLLAAGEMLGCSTDSHRLGPFQTV